MTAHAPLDSAVSERKASAPSASEKEALGELGQVYVAVLGAVVVVVFLPTNRRYSLILPLLWNSYKAHVY
jgi:hypothetical protein